MVGMYLARETTDHTLQEIAHAFNRHHTAIIHGHSTIEQLMTVYPSLDSSVEYLTRKVTGRWKMDGSIPSAFMPYANCNN